MHGTDGELIRQAQAGDRQAFGRLVQQHQGRVFSFVRRLCGNPDNALDITQDTFIKVWHALPDWRPDARFETWLLRIARNACIDVLRRTHREPEPLPEDDALIDPAPSPLRQLEGLSYQEIAAALEISEGTVKSRLARARSALLQARRTLTGDSDD
jgi:RNA polymerase sigma-70 factor (ECF subfamily)